ncbi:MAG: hypothetical protein LBS35_08050 [Synergistaceae bacterium]|nr:hypothetical protein [Synergistaceae bacterium]
MGGEPTLHPEFERFADYVADRFPNKKPRCKNAAYPRRDFMKAVHAMSLENGKRLCDPNKPHVISDSIGLFSSMGIHYKKHYEIIQDVFARQELNDHTNAMYHQCSLITRRELGVSDEDWVRLRDACWIQNIWSAGITPKGTFFCEIAGALDMLFDGPGGWVIERDWWKREPNEFGEQLHWCECCGFALDTFTRDANEEIDDVSPVMFERLKQIGSPKLKTEHIKVVEIENGQIAETSKVSDKRFSAAMPYVENSEARFNAANSVLFPNDFTEVVLCEDTGTGVALNRVIADAPEWIIARSEGAVLCDNFVERLRKYVLNPGTLHRADPKKAADNAYVSGNGFAAVFHKNALSLRRAGFDRIARMRSFDEIIDLWDASKVIELSDKGIDAVEFLTDEQLSADHEIMVDVQSVQTPNSTISEEMFLLMLNKNVIYRQYYKYKLLSKITFGKKRRHYKEKSNRYHEKVRQIRLHYNSYVSVK